MQVCHRSARYGDDMNDKEMIEALLDFELSRSPEQIRQRYENVLKYGFFGLYHQSYAALQWMCRERGIEYATRRDKVEVGEVGG